MASPVPQDAPAQIPPEANQRAANRAAYASFGEGGITATANAHGHLMQISRYFNDEPSGFLCVCSKSTYEALFVHWRMQDLESQTLDPDKGFRLQLEHETRGDGMPELSFVHDRWPCFSSKKDSFSPDVEYLISDETVYQTYTFKGLERLGTSEMSKMTIKLDAEFQDVDFISDPIKPWVSEGVQSWTNCLALTSILQGEESDKRAVLYVSPFIHGRAQEIRRTDNRIEIMPDSNVWSGTSGSGQLQITMAYTLKLVSAPSEDSGEEEWLSPVSEGNLLAARGIPKRRFEAPTLADDAHLNFVLRRNLEHILSVCSIPVDWAKAEDAKDEKDQQRERPVALTCGDIAGHRVTTAASFYAFQFLLRALEHFQNKPCSRGPDPTEPCDPKDADSCSRCKTKVRIRRVCEGHVNWILYNLEREPKSGPGCWTPQCWVSGKAIPAWQTKPWLADYPLIDTPFQIIKVADFCRMVDDKAVCQRVRGDAEEALKGIIPLWVDDLERMNKNGQYAFPRPKGDMHKFYFADHVLIWWAISSAEQLGFRAQFEMGAGSRPDSRRRQKSYSSEKVRSNILKRFTTQNPISKKRMLASSRSAYDTRFLLRAKDTVLFHAADLGIFDKPGTGEGSEASRDEMDEWRNTVACQKDHAENKASNWSHPLRFALCIILASENRPTNSLPPADMYKEARAVLLEASSRNGLLPGKLDEEKEPVLFDKEKMRDSWWYVTFELPYVLWRYREPAPQTPSLSVNYNEKRWGYRVKEEVLLLEKILEHLEEAAVSSKAVNHQAVKQSMPKQSVPFNNVIDQKNIVELADEWLYKQQDFFTTHRLQAQDFWQFVCRRDRSDERGRVIDRAMKTVSRRFKDKRGLSEHLCHESGGDRVDALLEQLDSQERRKRGQRRDVYYGKNDTALGFVTDMPKSRISKDRWKLVETPPKLVTRNSRLCYYLDGERTADDAKKRFIQVFQANPTTALACFIASSEKEDMSAFFDRHASYDIYFSEETATVLNTWVTELHLSFYQILPKSHGHKSDDLHEPEEIEFPKPRPDREPKWLRRAAMGFRFDGDLFDRYWTCHFFEHNPRRMLPMEQMETDAQREAFLNGLNVVGESLANHAEKASWRQRKVLELILLDRILKEMQVCTKEILKETKKRVLQTLERGSTRTGRGASPKSSSQADTTRYSRQAAATVSESFSVLSEDSIRPEDVDRIFEPLKDTTESPSTDDAASHVSSPDPTPEGSEVSDDVGKVNKYPENALSPLEVALALISAVDNDTFLSTSQMFHKMQQLLQVVHDDLGENLAKMGFWQDRERAREPDRPRWTHNDEQRYRSAIAKLLASNKRRALELRRTQAEVASYNASLTQMLEHLRSELNLRGADDVRLFTYATVAFLPLGFATGVFSMSSAPSGVTLGGMAGLAVVALVLTILALVNAKWMETRMVRPFFELCTSVVRAVLPLLRRKGNESKSRGDDGGERNSQEGDERTEDREGDGSNEGNKKNGSSVSSNTNAEGEPPVSTNWIRLPRRRQKPVLGTEV